jgi:hypothetical protein
LKQRCGSELADLQAQHPSGFLVRLHVLGDFYSVDYAELWAEALEAYPALHIFGYTARDPQSDIGQVVCQMLGVWPERFHIRFSGWNGPNNGAVVVDSAERPSMSSAPLRRARRTAAPRARCAGIATAPSRF